jgi:CRP-like cAMP-binding protein
LEPGDVLFAQGAVDATLYVVASGILELTRAGAGSAPLTLGNIGAGDYIGEISLLTGAPHQATARARTHCRIYELSSEAIHELLAGNAELVAALDRSARRGMDLVQRSVAASATGDVAARRRLLQRIREFFRAAAA